MKYSIYKPNSKNTGCAAAFQITEDKEGKTIMFLNAIQQASWDDARKVGSFAANMKDPEKTTSVMFNLTECGAMLYAFNSRTPKQFYHKTSKGTKSVTLSPWDKQVKTKVKGQDIEHISHAFGLSINVDGSKNFSIPLDPGEIENIKALITQGMLKHYGKKEDYERLQDEAPATEDTLSQ